MLIVLLSWNLTIPNSIFSTLLPDKSVWSFTSPRSFMFSRPLSSLLFTFSLVMLSIWNLLFLLFNSFILSTKYTYGISSLPIVAPVPPLYMVYVDIIVPVFLNPQILEQEFASFDYLKNAYFLLDGSLFLPWILTHFPAIMCRHMAIYNPTLILNPSKKMH